MYRFFSTFGSRRLEALVGLRRRSLAARHVLYVARLDRQLASMVAGTIPVFWIIGEVASIRGFHFLQVIYLVTSALVVVWTPARESEATSSR